MKKKSEKPPDALTVLLGYITHSEFCGHNTLPAQQTDWHHHDCWCGLNQAKRRFTREVMVVEIKTIKVLRIKKPQKIKVKP